MTAIDPSYVMQTGGGNNVTFLAPVSNTNLNIDAILNNVTQTIDVSSSMSPGTKEELQGLVEELAQQLKKVEKSHPEETEAIGEAAQSVINAATKDKPNRTTIKVSADGLKEAASTIAVAAPLALQAAQKIVDFIRANWL